MKDFLAGVKKKFKRIVWEPPPAWDADEAQSARVRERRRRRARSARQRLADGRRSATTGCRGPPGHKSRYEDPAIEKLAEIALATKNEHATYVFTNVDMFADAKRLKKAMKLVVWAAGARRRAAIRAASASAAVSRVPAYRAQFGGASATGTAWRSCVTGRSRAS